METANLFRPRFGDVPRRNLTESGYCVPSMIAIVTGWNIRETVAAIAAWRNRQMAKAGDFSTHKPRKDSVVAMSTEGEALPWLETAGIIPVEITIPKIKVPNSAGWSEWKGDHWEKKPHLTRRMTVGQWLKATADTRENDVYLCRIRGHVFLISGGSMVDNQEYGRVRHVSKMRGKKAELISLWCLMRDPAIAAPLTPFDALEILAPR